jgi:3-methylcrotonyl-CoA carboxylase alpha subunit
VEFLLDQDNNYYFMEMNTRLQVEHPVTEKITGFDLVEWQINIARGETLPVDQSAVGLKGHAIEARIYAEDPANNFLPASGKITHLQLPDESPELRVDNGTAVNETVGVFYDPMMMKVIGWGSSRDACISNLTVALGQLQVAGISTNRDFLIGMLNDKVFKAGGITTNYLDSLSSLSSLSPQSGEITEEVRSKQKAREVKDGGGDDEDKKSDLETDLALCAASLYITRLLPNRFNAEPLSPWDSLIGFRINQPAEAIIPLRFSGESYHLNIFNRSTFNASGMNAVCIKLDNRQYDLHLNNSSQRIAFSWQGQPFHYGYHQSGDYLTLFSDRRTFEVQLRDDYTQTILEEEGRLQAPMSGKIIEILAKSGEQVSKGQALIVMEAMKMEHTIIAPSNGRIKALNLAVDDLVEEGIALMEFEPDDTGVDIG